MHLKLTWITKGCYMCGKLGTKSSSPLIVIKCKHADSLLAPETADEQKGCVCVCTDRWWLMCVYPWCQQGCNGTMSDWGLWCTPGCTLTHIETHPRTKTSIHDGSVRKKENYECFEDVNLVKSSLSVSETEFGRWNVCWQTLHSNKVFKHFAIEVYLCAEAFTPSRLTTEESLSFSTSKHGAQGASVRAWPPEDWGSPAKKTWELRNLGQEERVCVQSRAAGGWKCVCAGGSISPGG